MTTGELNEEAGAWLVAEGGPPPDGYDFKSVMTRWREESAVLPWLFPVVDDVEGGIADGLFLGLLFGRAEGAWFFRPPPFPALADAARFLVRLLLLVDF